MEVRMTAVATYAACRSCNQPLAPGLFCQYCGAFVLDSQGTTIMASRISRLGAAIVNALLFLLTLGIGWIIWWFIVAPRGQNPGKAVVGLRVIRADGRAMDTGWMFVRGLVGFAMSAIVSLLGVVDNAWLLWDANAQTLHDKIAGTVVVRAQGSEHIVQQGSVGQLPAGYSPPPPFAPPVVLPGAPQAPRAETAEEALARLDSLRSRGLLTDEEYAEKRKAIVDRL
jgi:uncharacterized RDD family membrane protein YckC